VIIHQPEIILKNGEVCVSARVETHKEIAFFPDRLWFKFPETYGDYITDRSDGFLASLILMAMHFGEDLEVRGVISPRLAHNLDTFQNRYHEMLPGLFQQVDVRYDQLQPLASETVLGGVATAFSGGADSSFTLWSHLPQNEPEPSARLTHGLFIHGFDILLHKGEHYLTIYPRFAEMFRRLNLQLIQAKTNVYLFSQFRMDWVYAHEPPLVGTALVLGRLLKRFYKPGGGEVSHGRVKRPAYFIHLLSTETMETILDAPDITRFDKLSQIADWPELQDHLRVCTNVNPMPDGSACYQCPKCLSALLYLEILGVRPRYKNFPKPMTLGRYLRFCWVNNGLKKYFYPHLPRILLKSRRYVFFAVYWLMLIPSEIKNYLPRKILSMLPPNVKYRLKRKVFTSHLAPPGAAT